jgi:hypothetical protein
LKISAESERLLVVEEDAIVWLAFEKLHPFRLERCAEISESTMKQTGE